jgi:hypothetical protein
MVGFGTIQIQGISTSLHIQKPKKIMIILYPDFKGNLQIAAIYQRFWHYLNFFDIRMVSAKIAILCYWHQPGKKPILIVRV